MLIMVLQAVSFPYIRVILGVEPFIYSGLANEEYKQSANDLINPCWVAGDILNGPYTHQFSVLMHVKRYRFSDYGNYFDVITQIAYPIRDSVPVCIRTSYDGGVTWNGWYQT